MKKNNRLIKLVGAYLGFLIGSGVATGQEIMQYYTPYGFWMLATAVVIATIFIVANYCFSLAGRDGNLAKGSNVFTYYCGEKIGKAFEIFTVFFCYMSYVVMVSGASATLQEQYGIPALVGTIIIVVLVGITVAFGLDKIVDIVGLITPVMLTLIVVMVAIGLFKNIGAIPANIELMNNGTVEVTKAGPNWITSAFSNGGFCILWLASFSAALGKTEDFKTLTKANIISSIIVVVTNSIIGFALIAYIDKVSGLQIPNLYIVKQIMPFAANVFGVLIFLAIYTSACPLLWSGVDGFAKEDDSKFKIVTAILAIAGGVIALYVPFNLLMHYVYMVNGYLGFIVLVIMLVQIARKKLKNNNK